MSCCRASTYPTAFVARELRERQVDDELAIVVLDYIYADSDNRRPWDAQLSGLYAEFRNLPASDSVRNVWNDMLGFLAASAPG